MDGYVTVLCDSLLRQTTLVNEVIFVKTDAKTDGLVAEWQTDHIRFKILAYRFWEGFSEARDEPWYHMVSGHAFGLHRAITEAQNDFVWLCDPDQFLLMPVDKFYMETLERNALNYIGISHFNPGGQSYSHFPCIINLLCKKADLPPESWLQDELFIWSGMKIRDRCYKIQATPGKYLVAGPMVEHQYKFPNPSGMFDAGCNLWLWSQEQGHRWLGFSLNHWQESFQHNFGTTEIVYPMNYNQQHYQTNFELRESLGEADLLYHRTRGGKEKAHSFRKLYQSLFGRPIHPPRDYNRLS